VSLIDEAYHSGASLKKACEILGISVRTFKRWKVTGNIKDDQRKNRTDKPVNKLTDYEYSEILRVCNKLEFRSLPPTQIIPTLADKGVYIASESSFYRVLKKEGQLKHRGKAKPRTVKKPEASVATGPNQVWTWDITYLPTSIKGIFFYLYMIVDIYSRKIVAWEVHEEQSDEFASLLAKKAYLSENINGKDLVLHSDNGSPMKGATMLATLQNLGVATSFSRPSVSNDNPYSEALFKTLKYKPGYPAYPFKNINESRDWVLSFVKWYNYEHKHSGIKFVTPIERHNNQDQKILQKRTRVYKRAKKNNPARWSGSTRNWNHIKKVWLNPDKQTVADDIFNYAA
jgi:transposase InsO family protein